MEKHKQYEVDLHILTFECERVGVLIKPAQGENIPEEMLTTIRQLTYHPAAYADLMDELPEDEWLNVQLRVELGEGDREINIRIVDYSVY